MAHSLPASGASPALIDLNRLSRQVGVYGLEAMGRLVTLDVLVIGLKGVGVEAAKNLVLAGPRSVTLFDPEPATIADCGSNVSRRTRSRVPTPQAALRPGAASRASRPRARRGLARGAR
jgi:hypothetical protein